MGISECNRGSWKRISDRSGQLSIESTIDRTEQGMATSLFEAAKMMVKCDPCHGTHITCTLLSRGDVALQDTCAAVAMVKTMSTIQFID
jgi:antirestriction protein